MSKRKVGECTGEEEVPEAHEYVHVMISSVSVDDMLAVLYKKSELPELFRELVDTLRLKKNGLHEFRYDCDQNVFEQFDDLLSVEQISTILRKANGDELEKKDENEEEDEEDKEDDEDYVQDQISDYIDSFCDDLRKRYGEFVKGGHVPVNGSIVYAICIRAE
jgi:Sec-independent protein translocase protein TatA